MERYGCLVVGVLLALIILFGLVYLWSGWFDRPGGRGPEAAVAELRIDTGPNAVYHTNYVSRGSSAW